MMTNITGTGCLLSSVVGAFLTAGMERPLEATAEALSFYKRAGEETAKISTGPGDFAVNFLNTLHTLDREPKTFLV